MASDAAIATYALSLLGEDPITSLGDATERAKLVNRLYSMARDSALRAHPWNFAVNRQTLAQLAAAPAFGWAFQYELPTDPYCLRALSINDDEEGGHPGDVFKVEGHRLLTNATEANLKYIARITDPATFDPLFAEVFAIRLAAAMAYPIAQSTSLAADMMAMFELRIREARSIDGQEGSPDKQDVTVLTDVR